MASHWPLQRNKVRKALEYFTLIHAVDSLRLARFMDTVAQETGKRPRILLEVNVGNEDSKFGFFPETLEKEWPELSSLNHLEIAGLMCIPPRWKSGGGAALFPPSPGAEGSPVRQRGSHADGTVHGHEPRL